MKSKFSIALIFLIIFPLFTFSLTKFGSYYLEKGNIVKDNLIVIGDKAVIDGNIIGNVTFYGKVLKIDGMVTGNVFFVGEDLRIEQNAQINGNIHFIGNNFIMSDGATINGKIDNKYFWKNIKYFPLNEKSKLQKPVNFILKFLLVLFVFILFPKNIQNTVYSFKIHPITAFFKGFIAYIIFIIAVLLLFISIIGAPLALLLIFLFLLILLFSSTAASYYFGSLLIVGKKLNILKLFLGFLIIYIVNLFPLTSFIYYIFILVAFLGAFRF